MGGCVCIVACTENVIKPEKHVKEKVKRPAPSVPSETVFRVFCFLPAALQSIHVVDPPVCLVVTQNLFQVASPSFSLARQSTRPSVKSHLVKVEPLSSLRYP